MSDNDGRKMTGTESHDGKAWNLRYRGHVNFFLYMVIFLLICLPGDIYSQSWKFIKEKYGIKIYTAPSGNSSLKSFRGVAVLHTSIAKVYAIIGTVRSSDNWDENVKSLRVLSNEPDKTFSYYLVYSVTWPLHNRDLVVQATISRNPSTGEVVILSQARSQLVPEVKDLVRIRNYWQKWIIQQVDADHIRLILEGFADPAGNIPGWLYNLVITDTPLKLIHDIQLKVE
jgi:hypothetical protein